MIECPYCNKEQEVNHDDGRGFSEDCKHTQECGFCEKTFVFTTTVVFYYEPAKADCLNEGEHKWEATTTWPRILTRMECTQCGESRQPTEEEWAEINKEVEDELTF